MEKKHERPRDYQDGDTFQVAIEQMKQEAINQGARTDEEVQEYMRRIFNRHKNKRDEQSNNSKQP